MAAVAELEAGLPSRRTRVALREEVAALIGIFNDAWADNWGFVPFTPEDMEHLAGELRPLLHEWLVWFAEVKGEPAAVAVCLPNLNEAIRDLSGRLLGCDDGVPARPATAGLARRVWPIPEPEMSGFV